MEKNHPSNEERRIQGIAVSGGIAKGTVFLQGKLFREPARIDVGPDGVEAEHQRLETALTITRQQIKVMYDRVLADLGAENAAIFEAHLLVLEDSTVLDQAKRAIDDDQVCADYGFWSVMNHYIVALRALDDKYMSERVIDIEDVSRRVLRNLRGDGGTAAKPTGEHVLAAHDLTPSDTAMLDRKLVLGFITEVGGTTSHTAIMARSMQIPAVVGIPNLQDHLRSGDQILLDGYSGQIILDPTDETLEGYRVLEQSKGAINEQVFDQRQAESLTLDGKGIILSANIEFPHEADEVIGNGAQGVGLFRTEFAYLKRERPSEEELYEDYREITARLSPDLIIFRTVDLGGDKLEPGRLGGAEPNPFLGWRGIRYCLSRTRLFREQLRALLRASAHGKVGIMFPMICSVEEVIEARGILTECMDELEGQGVAFDREVQVGAMIEIPSAAVIADLIAPHVDFLSIGTNDLVQYSLAVDRINEAVAHLYQPTHPAVLRLINHTTKAGRQNKIWVGICGEMAGDLNLTPLLIGLGLDELSMAPVQVPRVKYALRKLDAAQCRLKAKEWYRLADPEEVYQLSRAIALEAYPELLK